MPSVVFITQLRANSNKPVIQFKHNGSDKSAFLQSVSEIKRDMNLTPGYCTVTVDNSGGDFDDFLFTHDYLTKKAEIIFGLGGFSIMANKTTLSFHDNGALADTIEDSGAGLIMGGIKAGMVIAVTGSTSNNVSVVVDSVTATVMTLAHNVLTEEIAGDSVTLTPESIPLITGYVSGANYDYDTKSMTLTISDRLSLALETTLQGIAGGVVSPYWVNFYEPTNTTKSYAQVVSVIVWNILTGYAKFDDTGGSGNTDIDSVTYASWAVDVDNGGYAIYDIGVVSSSEAVGAILLKIAQMTESVFWIGGDGKLKFAMDSPLGYDSFENEILSVDIDVSMADRVNYISTRWGYHPEDDTWESDHDGVAENLVEHGPLTEPYHYSTEIIEDRSVFHNTSASAHRYNAARLARTGAPPRYFTIRTQLLGFAEDIRNKITLLNLFDAGANSYDDFEIQIMEITFIPESWETIIKGQFIWGAGELP